MQGPTNDRDIGARFPKSRLQNQKDWHFKLLLTIIKRKLTTPIPVKIATRSGELSNILLKNPSAAIINSKSKGKAI